MAKITAVLEELAKRAALGDKVAAAAVLAGSMTPEEAQAGVVSHLTPSGPVLANMLRMRKEAEAAEAAEVARYNMLRLREEAKAAPDGSSEEIEDAYASWEISSDSTERYNSATGEMEDVDLPDHALIGKLYVPPEQRGASKGRQLLVEAVDDIRAKFGDIDIRLTADPFGEGKMDTDKLVEYYEGMGFELDGGSDTSMTLKDFARLDKYRAPAAVAASTAAGSTSASVTDESPWAQPTGGELMAKANQGFLDSIMSHPGSMLDPNTYDDIANTGRGMFDTAAGALGDIESALVGGIMQGVGGVGSWEEALKMLGGGLGQEIASTPNAGSKFAQGMEDYSGIFPTSQTIGDQPGIIPDFGRGDEERAGRFRSIGGFVSPI